ncbi:MAG: uroporphyrinogen-III synthase [SAR324 cluster bacterium]|nr:uroporphyrinogen-III synthase [SAR324 cluster bacterium]
MGGGEGPAPTGSPAARPLLGLTFFNTREASAAPALTAVLEGLGATVIPCPTLAFVPPQSWTPFDRETERLQPGQWIVFTSATAVSFVAERLEALGRSGPAPGGALGGVLAGALAGANIAAVGPATAEALERHGWPCALMPERYLAEGLLEALLPKLKRGDRVWQPRAEDARPVLEAGLAAAGIELAVTPVYRTAAPQALPDPALEALRRGTVDWIVFTSGSTAGNFVKLLPADIPPQAGGRPRIACLGEVTAASAREQGLTVAVVPERQELEGLAEAIAEAVRGGP